MVNNFLLILQSSSPYLSTLVIGRVSEHERLCVCATLCNQAIVVVADRAFFWEGKTQKKCSSNLVTQSFSLLDFLFSARHTTIPQSRLSDFNFTKISQLQSATFVHEHGEGKKKWVGQNENDRSWSLFCVVVVLVAAVAHCTHSFRFIQDCDYYHYYYACYSLQLATLLIDCVCVRRRLAQGLLWFAGTFCLLSEHTNFVSENVCARECVYVCVCERGTRLPYFSYFSLFFCSVRGGFWLGKILLLFVAKWLPFFTDTVFFFACNCLLLYLFFNSPLFSRIVPHHLSH